MPIVDLLVLAGGRGERLGGRDKAALMVGGRSLLHRVLEGAARLGGSVVVVGVTSVPDGVARTTEDPPGGGPVAGIAAGLQALRPSVPDLLGDLSVGSAPGDRAGVAPWVAVVAVDQPGAARALAALQAVLPSVPEAVDAVSHQDAEGHRQWLLAIYRRSALEASLAALGEVRNTSVRRLVADLRWHVVDRGAEHLGDVDTWEDAARWEGRLGDGADGD
ncbi:molybdenum cofactor guanylyltransferase [Ornithinimicrobium sp. W1665]|uniref:molybdenum cofactor guanylyltransferase n=1 Tax=Ornithinimicrobium sp. W1665 TaxID=3416666 RepID=UPI003CE7AF34